MMRSSIVCALAKYDIWMIKSRKMKLAGHIAHMDDTRNAFTILVGNCEGEKPFGRPRRDGNIKMNCTE
jgi:hypothetical protein